MSEHDGRFELDFKLLTMSDNELHEFAVENSPHPLEPYPIEEQREWAWNLLLVGTLDHMCTTSNFQAMDGCYVEIDSKCPHGNYSPMLLTNLL